MSCEDCAKAAAGMWHGFRSTCPGCTARAVARTPQHAEARAARVLTQAYRAVLQKAGVTHQQVKDAAALDRLGA
jgi:hypothetical protein